MSELKTATSALCAFADGKGYALGSIEGRTAIMELSKGKNEHFCFRCHRQEGPSQMGKPGLTELF